MRYLFLFILLIHGLIHILGFNKAFKIGDTTRLTKHISASEGVLWLIVALLFMASIVPFLRHQSSWAMMAVIAVAISQILIFGAWQDAKFGTIANLIILMVALPVLGSRNFENNFAEEAKKALHESQVAVETLVSESDLLPLPGPVQNYLRYVGVLGKPKVRNVKITFKGEMRGKGEDWFDFTSEQYNCINEPTRLFFMKAKVKGLSTAAYHTYQDGKAKMNVKVLSLYSVVDIESEELFRTETVTFFNDLCLFAPAALIDRAIKWETVDETTVKASFTNREVTISATLYFNDQGQLINFVSDDRMDINEGKRFRFSTPVFQYLEMNGYQLLTYGEAIWHYPEGEFTYGKFSVKNIEYNVNEKSVL